MYGVAILFILICCSQFVFAQFEQGKGIWDRTTSTTTEAPEEIVVKLAVGQLIGKKDTIKGVPWTAGRDRAEVQAKTRGRNDISPLPWKNDIDVFSFLGVPYAQPPVDNLRFKPPQKLTTLPDGQWEATRYRSACAQNIDKVPSLQRYESYQWNVDEDCLFLNVFTPQIPASTIDTIKNSYPVVVFFHGGNFQWGSANDWPAHGLASKGLVVVTVNYRLGPFGFMTLANGSPGNYGLYDQRMAIQWVQDNIYAFNGDVTKVTIVGQGSGAASVGLHMLSQGSRGLFHAAAALSGAEVSHQSVITNPDLAFNNTIRLGRAVGCSQRTTRAVFECIQTRSTNDIIIGVSTMRVEYNRFAFVPSVDGHFLKAAPQELLEKKQVEAAVPYLTGVNENDGSEALLTDKTLQIIDYRVSQSYLDQKIIEYTLFHNYTTNRAAIIEAIRSQYLFWPDVHDDERIRQQYMQMMSDANYISPVYLSARLHADSGSFVYQYVNNYCLGTLSDQDRDDLKPVAPKWLGVFHEANLYLLFGFPWMPRKLLPEYLKLHDRWSVLDRNMSEYFMESMRQFAKKKDPNLYLSSLWQNYDIRQHRYLDINVTSRVGRNYRWTRVGFWNIYLTQVANLWTTTLQPTIASLLWENSVLQGVSATFICLAALAVFIAATLGYFLFVRVRRSQYETHVRDKEQQQQQQDFQQYADEPPGYTGLEFSRLGGNEINFGPGKHNMAVTSA